MDRSTGKAKSLRVVLWALCVVLLFVCISFCMFFPKRYNTYVEYYCDKYNVQESLVYAIIKCESNYNPQAVSLVGATGLMQLMSSTAEWCASRIGVGYSKEQLTDPEYNIMIGVYYLSYLSGKFGYKDTIASYNAGEGNVSKWIDAGYNGIPFKETRVYVNKVLLADKVYKNFLGL